VSWPGRDITRALVLPTLPEDWGNPDQVLLRVRFAEVNRTITTELGLNLISTGAANTRGAISTGQFPAASTNQVTGEARTFALSDILNIFAVRPDLNLSVIIRDLQSRGLLEPGLGEEHARGELAELRLGLRAQLRLAEHRGDEAGRMTLPPQLGDDAHDVGLRVPLGQLVEEPQSLGGEEFDEVGAVHPATLASRTGDFRALALTLHECQIAPRLGLALSQ